MPNFSLDIEVAEFYEELYTSEKQELATYLRDEGFLDESDEIINDKFKSLKENLFRFEKEDEEILNKLFEKYAI